MARSGKTLPHFHTGRPVVVCRVGSSLSPAQNLSFPGSRTLPSDDHRPIKGTSQVAFVALGRLELAQNM